MPRCASSFAVTRLSSTAITSAWRKVSAPRGLISERLPIGVATIYRPGGIFGFMRSRVMAEQSGRPQARRSILGLGLAGLAALALAGCEVVPRPNQAPPPPPEQPKPERPRVEPQGPVLPPDETRNRVAVLVPLSGPNAGVGTSIANAAQLALLDTGGERIRITVYDTARAGGSAAAAEEALGQGNGLILGPLLAEDVRAVAPVARRSGVPVIAFSNDVSVAGDGVYLMGFTPRESIDRVIGYARSKNMVRFAALTPNGVYGRRAGEA